MIWRVLTRRISGHEEALPRFPLQGALAVSCFRDCLSCRKLPHPRSYSSRGSPHPIIDKGQGLSIVAQFRAILMDSFSSRVFCGCGRSWGSCITPWHLLPNPASFPLFHRYGPWESLIKILNTLSQRTQTVTWGQQGACRVYNLIWGLNIQVYAYVNTHIIIHLRFVHFTVYKS